MIKEEYEEGCNIPFIEECLNPNILELDQKQYEDQCKRMGD